MYLKRICEVRKEKSITQEKMAMFLNVSRSTYAKYEAGTRGIPLEFFRAIARRLEVSTDYLLEETEERARCKPSKALLQECSN